ncbi:MAG: aldo/keto reductase [Chloroflexi bacterium]|nr:MAG: aldo/keto reductase [Chloroflexota bacterium]
MEPRPLGRTGLSVTPIGFGLAAVGRPGYITLGRDHDLGTDRSVEALERRSHEVLSAAYDAGIRYFDAARSYGFAERFLSSWLQLRRLTPSDLTVGSKWGYIYVGDWHIDAKVHEVKDHSLAALTRQTAESRALLGDFLDLYQIHSATLESGVLEDLNPFQSVQATWNVLEPSAGPALAEAHGAGWGVIIKEVLANGRLAARDATAIAAALANPWVDTVLSGAITTEQLQSNLRALELRPSAAELLDLLQGAEPADQYWGERSRLPWT